MMSRTDLLSLLSTAKNKREGKGGTLPSSRPQDRAGGGTAGTLEDKLGVIKVIDLKSILETMIKTDW